MKKFPVISKSGKEYLVDVNDESSVYLIQIGYGSEVISLYIYAKEKYKSFFLRREKERFVQIEHYYYTREHNYYEEFKGSFVVAAKYSVERFEREKIEKIEKLKKLKEKELEREKEFTSWDGKC